MFIKLESIAFKINLILLAASTSRNVNVVLFTAIVASSQIEEIMRRVMADMIVRTVIAVAAGLRNGNTCFAVLVVLIIKYVGVFVNVMRIELRFFIIRTNLLTCHFDGIVIITVGVATLLLIVAIPNTFQTAGRASICAYGVISALCVGVIRFGNIIEIAAIVVSATILSARTTVDMDISLTSTPFGQVIRFYSVHGVGVTVIFILIITDAAGLRYGNTRFAILVVRVIKYVGVFQIVIRIVFPFTAIRADCCVTHLEGIDFITVGITASSLDVTVSYSRQTAGRTCIGLKSVLNARIVGIGLC